MKKRIFVGIASVAIIVWMACLILILGALYLQYSEEYQSELRHETYLVSEAVEQSGIKYLNQIDVAENHRITWIAEDGTVLYDSKVDASTLGNHGDRPEVIEAQKSGYGEDSRYSSTIAEKTMYSALKLNDKTVLRISETQFSIFTLIVSMLQPILIVLVMAVLLSIILASRISKKIVKPLNDIDLEHPERISIYEEVKPLAEKISEQNKELNKKISRLQIDVDEKTREANFRKEFTANVSHELKTPLTSISGFAEIIKGGIVKEKDIPHFAERIYDEAQRLITLVGDIIKLSQLDEGQIAAKKEHIDLYGMCQRVVETLESSAQNNNVTMEVEGKHIYVEAVEQILEEIIYNICDNAVKYNIENGKVVITVFEDNGHPAVKVSDTGIGIPKEDMDRIFERFYRVNKSHSKEIGGTGLGLSIVKHGTIYHNARIQIESEVGKGTDITIIFNS